MKVSEWQRLAKAKTKAGDVKAALQWAKERSSPLEKSEALQGVVEATLEPRAAR